MRGTIIFSGLAMVLGTSGALIAQKEYVLSHGRTVLLELAPRDPRSLMQGDYMTLDYAVSRERSWEEGAVPKDGHLVLKLDAQDVGRFVRFDTPGTPLAQGEFRLRYRIRQHRVRLGAESFFFQEGHADRYARARYGELRVADSGSSVLVGLRNDQRKPLGGDTP